MELQEFINKFAEVLDLDEPEALSGDTEIREIENWSSLSVMLTIGFFEEQFGKQISNSHIKGCSTIEDLYKLATEAR